MLTFASSSAARFLIQLKHFLLLQSPSNRNYKLFDHALVTNVVIGTENIATHALPNLSEEKKEEGKRVGKEGMSAFFLWTS